MRVDPDLIAAAARKAHTRIADIVLRTPLERATALGDELGSEVFFKLENCQHTGSFKLRGAANRLLTLSTEQLARGCVVASSGNHGAAVAYALQKLSAPGIVFVPEQTSVTKVKAIREFGGEVRFFGTDGLDTEQHARAFAEQQGMFYVSPYNDVEVIAGQGTCGIEIAEQIDRVDAVFVAVGGGGLISGIGSVLKGAFPGTRIYACQPQASPVMAESINAGRILDMPSAPTLSDGTAGGIESGSVTFGLCQAVVDEFILVSEAQVAAAMNLYLKAYGEPIEGAAGVAIAALIKRADLARARRVVVVICGGNVSPETLDSIAEPSDRPVPSESA